MVGHAHFGKMPVHGNRSRCARTIPRHGADRGRRVSAKAGERSRLTGWSEWTKYQDPPEANAGPGGCGYGLRWRTRNRWEVASMRVRTEFDNSAFVAETAQGVRRHGVLS